ncbi:MAG: bifunctional adenosylcobinamide kinase/adenosylcobinamide-phosphate guanylyltransferase [Oscillospiraceae bacterium]
MICTDVSCGVVPMDRVQRLWREEVGRTVCALARRADSVTRVFCGLPLRLK